MRKGGLATILVLGLLIPANQQISKAQTDAPSFGVCSGGSIPSTPMPGHYTGTWHSDGSYQFTAFGTVINLQISIDGTIDATVTPDGRLQGTATGKVDAPVTHDGIKDISSGTGTIRGQLQAVFSSAGSIAVLPNPVIDMFWGTFVGGSSTIERLIAMPEYEFRIGSMGCVDTSGTISETNFPEMNLTDDATGQAVAEPGIGSATGSWNLVSDSSAKFQALSQQVDAFIATSNALLADQSRVLSAHDVETQIAKPLRDLEATIKADPTISRCLLDRLAAWQGTVVPALLARTSGASAAGSLSRARETSDLVRSVHSLNLDCALPEARGRSAFLAAANTLIDNSIPSRSWAETALGMRERLLFDGSAASSPLTLQVVHDFHALLSASTGSNLLETARAAAAFGDRTDALASLKPTKLKKSALRSAAAKSKKKKKKGKPLTPEQLLIHGIASISAKGTGGSSPNFSWTPVSGASTYVMAVQSADGTLVYAWAGAATSVAFGDTSIAGLTGSENDGWSLSLESPYKWSVLALNGQGKVIGAAFNVKG